MRVDTAIRPRALTRPRVAPKSGQWLAFIANGAGLVLLLVFLFTVQPRSAAMHVGDVASETVVAQHKVVFRDRVLTQERQRQAAQAVVPVYKNDVRLAKQREQQADRFLSSVPQILQSRAPVTTKLAEARRLLPRGVPPDSLQQFASLSPDEFGVVRQRSLALLSQAEDWKFDSSHVTSTEISLLSTLSSRVTIPERTAIGEVLAGFLAPTMVKNDVATHARQVKAASHVREAVSTIYPGEVVVRRGDIVTPSITERLSALGLQSRHTSWQDTLASLLFAAVIVGMLFWYLHAFHASIITSPRLLLLIDASIVITVVGARLLAPGHVLLPLFLPVAAAPTFAAVLIAPEACVAITLAMAMLSGWIVANSFELTMYYFLTGAAGVLAIRQVRQIKQFIFAGAYIALFALITALAFGLIGGTYDIAALQEYVLAAAFNGFVSASLALGGFALLSGYFGVTTTLQLLELGQPSQPLLRRLTTRAPGTHNHSLILASMVERAAEEIGADSTAAKVGALYHDVGKTANPHCFVENQLGIGNIHDELRPEESARIIRGHVAQGLRLARQFRLPRIVLDAIAEHHGTMAIGYFLHKAQQESGDLPVDTAPFTYAGPKPQSKETALLLLADSCESAVRASPDHSNEKIREIVHRIFRERIDQGQLDECPLTLKDIERSRNAFCSVLNGLYHPRIEYPEPIDPVIARPAGADDTA